MITFLCYPRCTTCQKAQKWLEEKKIAYEFRDIKTDNPTFDELAAWHQVSGLPLKKFFNTSGLLYKSMDLKNKLPAMNEEEMVEKAKEKIAEIKKANNERVNQRIDNIFGYLWNGQEMDY